MTTRKAILLPNSIDPTVIHKAIELISEWEPGAWVVTLTEEFGRDESITLASNPPQWYETRRLVTPWKRTGRYVLSVNWQEGVQE